MGSFTHPGQGKKDTLKFQVGAGFMSLLFQCGAARAAVLIHAGSSDQKSPAFFAGPF
jgi:hypothetical protein